MGLDNPLHIAFLVLILLLVFGAKRLPELGRSLGSGMREFKQGISGHGAEQPQAQQPALTAGPEQPQAPVSDQAQVVAQPTQVMAQPPPPAQPAQVAVQQPAQVVVQPAPPESGAVEPQHHS